MERSKRIVRQELGWLPGSVRFNSVAYSPQGNVLFAGAGGNLQAFDAATGDLLGYYVGGVQSIALSPDGRQLALATATNAIDVTANPFFDSLGKIAVFPDSVVGGYVSVGTVRLQAPAPAGGLVINLSSNQTCASVPASVTIPPGSTSANFVVRTTPVTRTTSAVITARLGAASVIAGIVVDPSPGH